jgi:N-acetylglucosamine-6-phosphate deacetylase
MAFTGCTLAEALPTMTTTPAKLLGLSAERGQLIAGAMADLVLLTPQLEVAMTIAAGEIVYQSS